MADDKHDDKKDGKKGDGKAAAPAEAKGGGIKAILGPVLANLLLLGMGAGIGIYGVGLIFPPAAAGGTGGAEGHGDAAGGHGSSVAGDDAHGEDHSVLHQVELDLGAVKSNIIGQSGKRYIMMEVAVWVDTALGPSLAGGGHGGGPTSVVRILKSSLEEHLASYQLADFDSEGATRILEKKFGEIVDRELRQLFPKETRPVVKLVHKIVITGRMMQ
jgi:hypothetical protein